MASSRAYILFLEAEVYPVLARLPRRRRQRLLDDLHRIARYPEAGIDYTDTDSDGNPQHHVLTEEFLVTFYIDQALRRVLIHEISSP